MKRLFFLLIFMTFSTTANAKNIVILATGGTISGAGESATDVKYSSAKIAIDQIVKTIPGITKLADIKAEQIMQKASQDMMPNDWVMLAKKVNQLLSKSAVDAVVITHGTDTLEETAYFLNLTIKSSKPVILVGAMRPATSLSADGALNLYNAVALAASDAANNKGVLVLMNDEIFAARDVVKSHTSNLAAFKSGAIGAINYGAVKIYYNPLRAHTKDSEFDVKKISVLPKVEIAYIYAGADPELIEAMVKNGAKAIILAGVGDGNCSAEILYSLKKASKNGVVIVRSSRTNAGLVIANSEINDDEFGFVTADNLNPQKARVLTMLALTKTDDAKKIRAMFGKY